MCEAAGVGVVMVIKDAGGCATLNTGDIGTGVGPRDASTDRN